MKRFYETTLCKHHQPSGIPVVCATSPNSPRPTEFIAATCTTYRVLNISPSNVNVRGLLPVTVSDSSTAPPGPTSCTTYPSTGAKSLLHGTVQLTLMKLCRNSSTVINGRRGSPTKTQQVGDMRSSSEMYVLAHKRRCRAHTWVSEHAHIHVVPP